MTAVATWDFTSPTLVDSTSGVTLTCTRASDKYIADDLGLLRYVQDNIPAFKGATYDGNLYQLSDPSTSGPFAASGSLQTSAETPPSGYTGSNVLKLDGNFGSPSYFYDPGSEKPVKVQGATYRISCYIKRDDGGVPTQAWSAASTDGHFVFALGGTLGANGFDYSGEESIGGGWYWCWGIKENATAGGFSGILQYIANYNTDSTSIHVCGVMLEDITGKSITTAPTTFYPKLTDTGVSGRVLTGTSEYLDIEPAATNQLIYSEDFTQANWVKNLCTATGGQAGAPNGTATMTRLLDDNGGGTASNIRFQYTVSSAMTPILSVYAKKDQLDWVYLNTSQRGTLVEYAYYDLTNGVVGATTGTDNVDQGIEHIGNGVYRCWMRLSNDADAAWLFNIQPANADGDHTVARDGTSSIFVYGAQAEDGTDTQLPSTYIPTNGSTVTRAADSILINNDATLGAVTDNFSWLARFKMANTDTDSRESVFCRSTSTAGTTAYDRMVLSGITTRTGQPAYATRSGGNVDGATAGAGAQPIEDGGYVTDRLWGSKYVSGSEAELWVNGAQTVGDIVDNNPLPDYDSLEVGDDNSSGGGLGVSSIHFYHLGLYSPALSDAQQTAFGADGTLPTFGMVVGDEDWTRRRKLLEWARSGIRPFGGHKWK